MQNRLPRWVTANHHRVAVILSIERECSTNSASAAIITRFRRVWSCLDTFVTDQMEFGGQGVSYWRRKSQKNAWDSVVDTGQPAIIGRNQATL